MRKETNLESAKKEIFSSVYLNGDIPTVRGIYVICLKKKGIEQIVYIGVSGNIKSRLSNCQHVFRKLITDNKKPYVRIAKIDNYSITYIESLLISEYNPPLNKKVLRLAESEFVTFRATKETKDILKKYAKDNFNLSISLYFEKLAAKKAKSLSKCFKLPISKIRKKQNQ